MAATESSTAELVGRARDGEREAFGELYRRYAGMVHGILLARLPHPEVADAAQDVFLRALRHLGSLRDAAAFGGWLATLARTAAVDWRRRPASRAAHEPLDERMAGEHGVGAEELAVLEAIRALPAAYAETLLMRLVEGMTGPEIAARTGLTPESVRVNLCRGMKRLREALGGSSAGALSTTTGGAAEGGHS
ncbi:MAG TPA: sigma-70 family RNA polymerase sigma factor [Thermoanaerobaculia bacterium]|nr:sigma-70 family RNA polymerase sigma factor [Thermoanaerobaculia bacterium]